MMILEHPVISINLLFAIIKGSRREEMSMPVGTANAGGER